MNLQFIILKSYYFSEGVILLRLFRDSIVTLLSKKILKSLNLIFKQKLIRFFLVDLLD